MSAAKTQATAQDQSPPVQVAAKQPERPAKSAGPQQSMMKASASAAPPPNGGFSITQAADMLNGKPGAGAGPRAGMMRTLQRSVGNNRIGSLSHNAPPAISRSGPKCSICRKCGCESGGPGGCAGCREKQLQRQETNGAGPSAVPESVQNVVGRSSGTPLQGSTRDHMENAFGTDFGGVRVHTDSQAAHAARDINAEAFTHGQDIFFGGNRFQPDTPGGQKLLAHELTHTIQQRNSSPATAASDLSISHPDDAEEVEAEAVASRVVARSMAGATAGNMASPVSVSRATSGHIHRYSWDEFESDVNDVGQSVVEVAEDVGTVISDTAGAVVEGGAAVVQQVGEAAEEGIDWLVTEAGQAAQALAGALGVPLTITPAGLVITIPGFCPLDAMVLPVPLPEFRREFTVPFAFPLGPVVVAGVAGLAATLVPTMEVQIGPICLGGVSIVINPITGNYSISGSVSATTAASLAVELRGGVLARVSIAGVLPVGPFMVPIAVPNVGLEGGLVGMIRGTAAQTITIGGGLGYSGGLISLSASPQLDLGFALDLFAGAYGQLSWMGQNLCRLYWQPYEWHGDTAFSLGTSIGLVVSPGGSPSVGITVAPPSLAPIPFSNIPLALSREGFHDDCPFIDALCDLLRRLGVLPSMLGGSWNWSGPYGPGPRLAGPKDVYQARPPIASGAFCRGACGYNCLGCNHEPTHTETDPATGDIWEYRDFEDCNTHEGCQEHDAGFDWAADVKGETGGFWTIFMPWHMAANIECVCNNLGLNCAAWAVGLPPFQDKIYFATSSKIIGKVSPPSPPTPVIPPGPPGPPIGPSGAGDTCSNPLSTEFDMRVDGKDRVVKYRDQKHTQMAKRTIPNMVSIAGVADCDKDLTVLCEQVFCKAAKAKNKSYGSQIDKPTRKEDRIEALLAQAWAGKRPPSSGAWEETAIDSDDVGFDLDIGGGTKGYRVKTTVTTGGKVFTETHLFPDNKA
jgi:hypothetical protein